MAGFASTPLAATPRALSRSSNSPRPQPISTTSLRRAQERHVLLHTRADVCLGSPEPIFEADVGRRLHRRIHRRTGWQRAPDGSVEPAAVDGARALGEPLDLPFEREQPLFGQREAFLDFGAGKAAVLAVDVERDRPQVLQEQRLEPDQALEGRRDRLQQVPEGARAGALELSACRLACSTSERVELFLALERRPEHPPRRALARGPSDRHRREAHRRAECPTPRSAPRRRGIRGHCGAPSAARAR